MSSARLEPRDTGSVAASDRVAQPDGNDLAGNGSGRVMVTVPTSLSSRQTNPELAQGRQIMKLRDGRSSTSGVPLVRAELPLQCKHQDH